MASQRGNGIPFAIVALVLSASPARSEVLIEGSRELLDVVLAAQRTNETKYKRGSLLADVSLKVGDSATSAEVEAVWSEAGTYWKHTSSVKKQGAQRASTVVAEVIRNPKQWLFFDQKAHLLQFTQSRVFTLAPELEVLPSDVWFTIDKRIAAADFLDPQYKAAALSKYVIKEEKPGRIVIERHYKVGGYYSAIVSLPHGGNIVAYDTRQNRGDGVWMRGHLDWVQDNENVWNVKKLRLERSVTGSPDEIDTTLDVTYKRVDYAPVFSADRFSIASLKMPEGTKVEEYDASGNVLKRSAITSKGITQQDLDELSDALRKGRLSGK